MLDDLVNYGRSNEKKGIGEIRVGNFMIENLVSKVAEHFNSRLCSVGTKLGSKISRRNRSHYLTRDRVVLRHSMQVKLRILKLN